MANAGAPPHPLQIPAGVTVIMADPGTDTTALVGGDTLLARRAHLWQGVGPALAALARLGAH